MFTGLISELGVVESVEAEADGAGVRIRVSAGLAGELAAGDSIAVNGVCLTAAALLDGCFEADVMRQTSSVTTIGALGPGDRVNLELPLRVGDRLGGHLVQGHVDGVGTVTSIAEDGLSRHLRVELPGELEPLVVERGSVAIDGVSLTVAALGDRWFEVSLIPETLERTTLSERGQGDRVNLECDIVGRYVQRLSGVVRPFEPEPEADD